MNQMEKNPINTTPEYIVSTGKCKFTDFLTSLDSATTISAGLKKLVAQRLLILKYKIKRNCRLLMVFMKTSNTFYLFV